VAAVCGLAFDAATLAAVQARPVVEVLEALDGAIEAALVVETDRHGRYAFAHALVGETIVSGLPRIAARAAPPARSRTSSSSAIATARAGAGDVARHLRAAGALAAGDDVAAWELAAAREATAALAHAEAASHLEAALAARPGIPAGERSAVLLAAGHAHDRAGRRRRARAAFVQAAELARSAGDADLLAQAALGHGGTARRHRGGRPHRRGPARGGPRDRARR
jgi:tetratricopeptide (TPR) repeat protein